MGAEGHHDEIEEAARVAVYHEALIRDLAAADGDERQALRAVMEFLNHTHVDSHLSAPLMRLLGRLTDEANRAGRGSQRGRPEAPVEEQLALTMCAATATVLQRRTGCPVADAEERIARLSGIDRKRIKSQRGNLNRRNWRKGRRVKNEFQVQAYDDYVAELCAMTDDEFEAEALRRIELVRGAAQTPSPRKNC